MSRSHCPHRLLGARSHSCMRGMAVPVPVPLIGSWYALQYPTYDCRLPEYLPIPGMHYGTYSTY
eukprot:scaffold31650_cov56-Attheya_sp.AAC.1